VCVCGGVMAGGARGGVAGVVSFLWLFWHDLLAI
jgi:hypothetical protein